MRTYKANLRKVNRVLRWTGWRLTVLYDPTDVKDTMVYLAWHGWGFLKHLDEDLQPKDKDEV